MLLINGKNKAAKLVFFFSKKIFLIGLVFVLSGCMQDSDHRDNNEIKKLKEEIRALQDKVDTNQRALDSRFGGLQKQIDNTSSKMNDFTKLILSAFFENTKLMDSVLSPPEATFTPASTGYAPILTPVGVFFVKLRRLSKYIDGYKVTFSVGNPNYATFRDVGVSVKWGNGHSTEQHIMYPLAPGFWEDTTFTISPAKPDAVHSMIVSLAPNTAMLKDRKA